MQNKIRVRRLSAFWFAGLIGITAGVLVPLAGCSKTTDSKPAALYDAGKEADQKAVSDKQQADAARRKAAIMPPPGAMPPGATMGGPPPLKAK